MRTTLCDVFLNLLVEKPRYMYNAICMEDMRATGFKVVRPRKGSPCPHLEVMLNPLVADPLEPRA
jgi:hypothetical protein